MDIDVPKDVKGNPFKMVVYHQTCTSTIDALTLSFFGAWSLQEAGFFGGLERRGTMACTRTAFVRLLSLYIARRPLKHPDPPENSVSWHIPVDIFCKTATLADSS